MNKILVGSVSFFKGIEGFKSADNYIQIIDKPKKNSSKWWSKRGENTFEWVKHDKEELLKKLASTGVIKKIAAILTPELSAFFNITIDDIKNLEHIWNRCEGKNAYYKYIANTYIENNGFFLSDAQKSKAYEIYKKARN